MEGLQSLLNEIDTSEEEIHQAREKEPNEIIDRSHDSERREFKQSDEGESLESEGNISISKNKTIWHTQKLNHIFKMCSQNVITNLPVQNITNPLKGWELFVTKKL
ncbi:hypothetical protein NPIL_280281 [Nephila pilipes]|uniref:Uncharacterized protein n=1 Tax=Nephila pilipes TaxID=299642 RepID=A0A8X6R5P5_NEPPI|nr:hypothetical protein NPIL_280281 [Nephila pilipes]